MTKALWIVFALLLACGITYGGTAHLVAGYGHPPEVPTPPPQDRAYLVDETTGEATTLWGSHPSGNAMAYDTTTHTLYVAEAVFFYSGPVVPGQPPQYRGNLDVSVSGLAFGNGKLYGSHTGSSVDTEGIYEIDLQTLETQLVFDVDDGDFSMGGLAFNPDDGLLYATDEDGDGGRGLYAIDLQQGTMEFVTPFPAGVTTVNGLAIGEGIAYLVDEILGDTIHRFDLAAGEYLTSLPSPLIYRRASAGAAWIPEPSSAILLLAGAAFCLRRWRRA